MNEDELRLAIRRRLRDDFPFYAEKCLRIRTKDKGVVPFKLNAAQAYLHSLAEDQLRRTGMVRKIVIKGRQQGISTYIGARFYHKVTHQRGKRAFVLTHDGDATENLFGMTERFHEHCPAEVKAHTGRANAKEITFDILDSSYSTGTAGNKAVGVSQTIQYFHASEVALWPNAEDHVQGILQAVPMSPGTEVWMESTSRGIGNLFHKECVKAIKKTSLFELVFIPWFWQTEYRVPLEDDFQIAQDEAMMVDDFGLDAGQLMWRRTKIAELGEEKFKREYPNTFDEAFEITGPRVLIGTRMIRAAIERDVHQVDGPIIWGVDCSLGGDASTLAKRRTNKLLEPVKELLQGQASYDTIAVARAVLREYRETPPSKRPSTICVDSIGIGAGVSAQMNEDGLPVMDVNVSERTSSKARFMRLRDELWWDVREWFTDMRTSMPEDEALIVELAGVTFDDLSAAGRIKIEGKKDMIKRLGYSPDRAEAFMLTFAASDIADNKRSYEPPSYVDEIG